MTRVMNTKLQGTFSLLVIALSLLLSGCITTITSKRVGEGVDGQEYALPLPMIELVPQPDGTLTATVKLVPDPNNRYVISASSILSSYTLDVQTEDGGLLRKVSLDAKSADVASDVLKEWGEVRKAELTAQAEKDKAAEDKAEKAATDAAKALSDAQLSLDKAEAKLQKLEELSADPNNKIDQKDIVAAQVAVAEARVVRDAAAAGVTKGTSKAAADAANGGNGFPQAWGPVYYSVAVEPNSDGKPTTVKLIPASFPSEKGSNSQVLFDTSEAGKPAEPETASPRLAIKGDRVLAFKATGRYQLTVEVADGRLDSVDDKGAKIVDPDTAMQVGVPTLNLQASGTAIAVSFAEPRSPGEYELDIPFVYRKTHTIALPVFFKIE